MEHKILLIEDEKEIREVVMKYLEKEGYSVCEANNGLTGLRIFKQENPDLVVLDVMMPGIDGYKVLDEIRNISEIPVIMLTAKYTEEDKLKGFDGGADDYVIKPFSPRELVKRVNAVIKRTYKEIKVHQIDYKNFHLDLENKILRKDDLIIELTSMEYNLIEVFMKNIGRVLTREQLIEMSFENYDAYDRGIDSHIKKIRHKLEDDSKNPEFLKTKYGFGYVFGGDLNDN